MKSQIKRFSKSTLSVILSLCMLVSCMTVGIIATDAAQYNQHWQAKELYFVVPDSWDLSTYSHVQVDITRSTSVSSSTHQAYSGDMTRIGTSRLYYIALDIDHSSWNQNEYIAFTANSSKYGDGNFTLNTNHYYTTPKDYGVNNSSNYFVAVPDSDANGCTVSIDWNATRDTLMKKTQKANVYTDKASSSTGGSVSLSGYYFSSDTAISSSSSSSSYDSVLGTTMTMTATANTGYAFDGWYSDSACTTKLSSNATYSYTVTGTKTVYANFNKLNETYTSIAVAAKGSTDGSTYTTLSGTPATISANSYTTGSSALTITAGEVSGYTFAQWVVTAGSGTIGSDTTANTTFTPSASNTTVTAQYKKNYTFSNGTTDTHGTVTVPSGTVLAGASYSGTVTPADGYKIKTLTVGGVAVSAAVGKTSAYTYSGTTGSSTTGTSTPISVVATFEANTAMNLYIAGRFRVRPSEGSTSWTTTYASGSDWNDTSTNIPFTYLSGTTYKVDTYATLAELSAKIGSSSYTGDPVFFVYDTTNNKNWYASSATTMSTSGTTLVSSGGADSNLKFSSTSTDSPVTIYYDANSHKIWYYVPTFYDITVTSATGGTVTANPARATEGSAITLEVEPNDHYRLKSISAVQNGVAGALPLTETEDGYSFTMPAGNVTVTPVFEPIPYTGITYSAKGSKSADALTDLTDTAYTETLTAPTASGNNNPATGTYVSGINISAPTINGYTFYKWVATNGTFTKDSNVTESETANTKFYPMANGATLKALYRYNFNISLNSPSNGSITTNKTSCLAGDQYEITLTPASGYKLKSLKINNVDIDIATSSDIVISSTGYKYTGVAGGSGTSVSVVAEFEEIPDTVIYVNKYIYTNEDLLCAYIWSTIQGEQHPVQAWPGERYDRDWEDDSNYPDYKKRTFRINSFGTFQIIFNNGSDIQTTDSDEYLIGGTYFINTATANSKAVLTPGYPVYRIVGQQALVGSDWNASGDDNHMTETSLGSGVFTLDKTGVNKTSSGYKYKAITGNNYDYGQYPEVNTDQTIHVLYDNSNVNFTYTPSTPSLVATVSGGEFKAQTADVAHGTAVISESQNVTGSAKSVTLSADKSYTESNYSSGYTTKTVYIKATPNTHYEVSGWSQTPESVTKNGDVVTAKFTVNQDVTITPVITIKHHNVFFTPSPTGGTVAVNNKSTSPQTVNETASYTILVTPSTGYKIKTFTVAGVNCIAGYSDDQKKVAVTYNRTMGEADETVTVEFEKIGYTLTGEVIPAKGNKQTGMGYLEFYEDNNGSVNLNKEITTATYQQYFWAVYTSENEYTLQSISATGGNTKPSRESEDYANNRARFRMGSDNATIRATVVLQHSITFYIDMHNTDMSKNKKVSVELYDKDGNILKDKGGTDCKADLTRVNNKTNVYSASIVTPFTENNSSYEKIVIKPKYNGNYMEPQELDAAKVSKLLETKEVWLEAVNEQSQELKLTYDTKANPEVPDGYRRIYLAKPASMTDSKWVNIGIYYWGSDYGEDGGGWLKGTAMERIGGNDANDGEYCYYRVDIPKTLNHTIGDQTVKDKIDNIIFQGWSSKTRTGDAELNPDAQTEDIKQIADSDNFFVLSESGGTYVATSGDSVVIPDYTRYVTSAKMNVNVYDTLAEGSEIKINPNFTGEKINYTVTDNQSVVSVDGNGKITPLDSGTATIKVRIYGTIGKKLKEANANYEGDYVEYNVSITVKDPGKLEEIGLMALESQNYTVNIPDRDNMQPGFFDMDNTQITVTGIAGASSSTTSAIINPISGIQLASFTVKYAKSNSDFAGYNNIKLTGNITTKSIRREGANRYGLAAVNPWKSYLNDQNETDVNCTTSKSVTNGQETVLSKNIEFSTSFDTYSAIFEEYQYVDVTFVYDYYEYVPQIDNKGTPDDTSDDMVYYQYQPDWAGANGRFETGFNTDTKHNTLKNYTVNAFEVRNVEKADLYNQAASIAEAKLALLVSGATAAIGVMPSNNYYSYSINGSTLVIPKTEIEQVSGNNYAVKVFVHMNHSPQTYSVVLNGIPDNNGSDNGKYYYQESAVLNHPTQTANKVTKWYAVEKNAKTINTDTDPLLATGDGYEFRVKGDTYIRTQEADNLTDKTFNRSEVDFSHYEVIHRDNPKTEQEELVDYLLQNFYIADFFDPNKVFATRTIVGSDNTEEYKPEDPQFVGGGVVYFSVDGTSKLPRSSNAVGFGYVNSDGTLNKNAVKEMLKSEILSSVNNTNYNGCGVTDFETLSNTIGEQDALKVAYGTEIDAHQYVENNIKTGVLYRYLPLETFSNDSNKWDSSTGTPLKDDKQNYYTTLNNNTFRYSNTLQSYQYVYASGNENKETNNGRDMRLYSYYVYSYVAYNQETNVPETKYEIVISDNYSDASTYWNGNTGN